MILTLSRNYALLLICALYLCCATVFATATLDGDEFGFSREPYEMLGGDYTAQYLREHDYKSALSVLARSYYFFWNYRPLNAPIVSERSRHLFEPEEGRFNYTASSSVSFGDPTSVAKYEHRMLVPEPDRFYRLGAGKPLLPAVLEVPQLALAKAIFGENSEFLKKQFYQHYDWKFVIFRLVQIVGGLLSVILVYAILAMDVSEASALLGAAIFALFPITIKYFPNLHHDSILTPFILATIFFLRQGRYLGAGACYGLALASKNVAIILAPAAVVTAAFEITATYRDKGTVVGSAMLRQQILGLSRAAIVALLVFLPFANPVSYVEEILTPFISRPVDHRGENISQWQLNGWIGEPGKTETQQGTSTSGGPPPLSPQVVVAQKFLYFRDIGFLFFALAVCLAASTQLTNTARLALITIGLYLPLGSVFGYELNYRVLFLVPLFVILIAELAARHHLRWVLTCSIILSALYLSHPTATDLIHQQYIGPPTPQDR